MHSRQPATSVWLGDEATKNASKEYKTENTYGIEAIILHPEYKENEFFRNIGLARLDREIDFNPRRYPVCLEINSNAIEEDLLLASYNRIEERVSLTNYGMCNDYFDLLDILDSEQFCGSVKENCYFPSGSVLQRKHESLEKVFTVLGVISFRKDCKIGASQVVFTRITYFAEWIEKVVKGGEKRAGIAD